jgi:hypothetical protein
MSLQPPTLSIRPGGFGDLSGEWIIGPEKVEHEARVARRRRRIGAPGSSRAQGRLKLICRSPGRVPKRKTPRDLSDGAPGGDRKMFRVSARLGGGRREPTIEVSCKLLERDLNCTFIAEACELFRHGFRAFASPEFGTREGRRFEVLDDRANDRFCDALALSRDKEYSELGARHSEGCLATGIALGKA